MFFVVWYSETLLIRPPSINWVSDKKMTAFTMTSPTNYIQCPRQVVQASPMGGPWTPSRATTAFY